MKSLIESLNLDLCEARDIISIGCILTLKRDVSWADPETLDEWVEEGYLTAENSELLDDFLDLDEGYYLFLKNTKFEYVRKDEDRYILREVNSGAEIFILESEIKRFVNKSCKKL